MTPSDLPSAVAPGFIFRPGTADDAAAVHALLTDCQQAEFGQRSFLLEDVRRWWSSPGYELAKSTQLAFDEDGRLAGYASLFDLGPTPVDPFLYARVRPGLEGRGLGSAFLAWSETVAPRVFERLEPDVRVLLCVACAQHLDAPRRLFADHGFEAVRHGWTMAIDLAAEPAPPSWPEGIRSVPYLERGDLREVAEATCEAFKDHWGNLGDLDDEALARWQHKIDAGLDDPTLWTLALDGDEIAGVCFSSPRSEREAGRAYVETVAVRRPWRRRGIATALLQHAFGELWRRGHHAICLDVDSESLTGATRLYEKAGMHVLWQVDSWEKELRPGRDVRTTAAS
jgi:GNAT superfamily N-acetyltransferase